MCDKNTNPFLKRAKRKYISNSVALHLVNANPNSPLLKSYMSTHHCNLVLQQDGKKITASYCKQRWCAICAGIRTANAITGYLPEFKEFTDAHFVTLTKKSVVAAHLPASIKMMEDAWRLITHMARRCRVDFKGVRKVECTVRPGGYYHYHFHLIIEGKENAEWLVGQWLSRLGDLASAGAQDIRRVNDKSYVELFKYATKLVASSKDQKRGLISFEGLDVVFRALRSRKTYYPFGGLRKVSEDIDELHADEYEYLTDDVQNWLWQECDWVNEVGKLLTGYTPNDDFKELFKT